MWQPHKRIDGWEKMMKTVTVAHCADIHYDSDIVYMGAKGRIRKRERQASFENILKMCRHKHIE